MGAGLRLAESVAAILTLLLPELVAGLVAAEVSLSFGLFVDAVLAVGVVVVAEGGTDVNRVALTRDPPRVSALGLRVLSLLLLSLLLLSLFLLIAK